ncbi:MAG TPA: amidase family protein, partial [Vicinamibacterales bacterium]|nr:amidase family protein [Vicinamibacterales bacterium]
MRLTLAAAAAALAVHAAAAQNTPRFAVEETTIDRIEAALRDGSLTCRSLVEAYIRRIDTYDKNGPALNAIVMVNPDALKTADDLDRRFRQSGPAGPLHCVPVIVKDNYETVDMPTTAGSRSLEGMMTGRDAFVVKRLRGAGALMLARSNMAEFAFSPVETVSSILPGYTRNPYDTSRVTAGSSGGSAAAAASSFGAVALASDTGDSIRGPASHLSLVGLRSTMGLVSRGGVVPLSEAADIAGAVTRTVADTAAVLQVIAGEDPADPVTASGRGHVAANYAASLDPRGLNGARVGVLHEAYEPPPGRGADSAPPDPEIVAIFHRELDVLTREGAT